MLVIMLTPSRFVDTSNSDYFIDPAAAGTSMAVYGNVGIGTTSPSAKLEVSGTNTGKALTIFNETGTNDILTASASGIMKFIIQNTGALKDEYLTSGINLSETNSTGLTSDFTASSIVGGLNELKTGGGIKYLPIIYEGTAQDEDAFFDGFTPDQSIVVTEITLSARNAPTGADLQIDLLKNSAEQSTITSLTAGSNYETTNITDTTFTTSDTLGLKIKQIGSTVAGESFNIILHYTEDQGDQGRQYLMFPYIGFAEDENDYFDGLFFDSPTTISQIGLHVRTAPSGAALTIDLLKNGAERSRITTLRNGGTYQTTNVFDDSFTTSQRLGLRVKSIGSTTAGNSILTILHLGQGPTRSSSLLSILVWMAV